MEHSKVWLLMRDIVSKGSSRRGSNKQVVKQNCSDSHQIYRIKRIRHTTHPRQQTHIPSIHDHITIMPLWYMHSSFSHAFISYVSHLYVFLSSLQLTWLADPALVTLVYPNQMQYMPHVLQGASLLGGVDASVHRNGRRFSKTSSYPPCCHYASILFYPYFLMTSSSPSFLLIHSFPQPTLTLPCLTNQSHTLYCLCSSIVSLILLDSETSSNYGRTM